MSRDPKRNHPQLDLWDEFPPKFLSLYQNALVVWGAGVGQHLVRLAERVAAAESIAAAPVNESQRRTTKATPRGTWLGVRVELPTEFPPYFPPSLRLRTGLILAETAKEFPRSQLEQFCKEIVIRFTDLLCTAVREGVLKAHDVPYHLNELLHYVRVANCDNANEGFRIEKAVINSDEWHAMVQRLVECEGTQLNAARGAKPTSWGQVDIRFLSDHRVQIVVGEGRENANYAELGFEDARNGKPKAAWQTLRALAEGNGVLEYSKIEDLPNIEKRMQELRSIFRRKFGLVTDPIPRVRDGYRAAFKIGTVPSFNT